ncbi:MAG: extradiol ring-cleavage dioxygenase [Candidatus Tectimicrobiota bacterium]
MAQIVLGLATSHSPQLSTPATLWSHHGERDKRNPDLRRPDGRVCTYEELVAAAGSAFQRELTPKTWQTRYEACQQGLAQLAQALTDAAPDVLIIIGDDQKELFQDDNMPAMLVYWGETIHNTPRYRDTPSPALQAAAWAYGEKETDYPVATSLATHLIGTLMEQEFDIAHSRHLPPGQGMGHAFSFIYGRIMHGTPIPIVPVMLNTYYAPNQPTPKRCYALGQAIQQAVESWPQTQRVAVIASGGLSHFVIDEDLDQRTLRALQQKDAAALTSLPRASLDSGNSEIRNWIAVAGAVEHLDMHLVDYVPCYRSPAGTGCAMGFATWS